MKKLFVAVAALAMAATALAAPANAADKKFTIALIPGITTDAFYITMHKGAQAAADALGVNLIFQGGSDFSPTSQVPVLQAVIAKHPDALLIAPTDKTQLVAPLQQDFRIGKKTRGRDQHRPRLRQFAVVGNVHIGVVDDFPALNEWHRRAP